MRNIVLNGRLEKLQINLDKAQNGEEVYIITGRIVNKLKKNNDFDLGKIKIEIELNEYKEEEKPILDNS